MSNLLRTVVALTAFIAAAAVVAWGVCREKTTGNEVPQQPVEQPTEETQDKVEPDAAKRTPVKTDQQWVEYFDKQDQESKKQRSALIAEHEARGKVKRKRPGRRIRRFQWNTADLRGKMWNVPEAESEDALLTAFIRVCFSEADGNPQDCVGIWQVINNLRRRTCARGYVRRITECEEGGGETLLSAIKRAQPHILEAPGYKLRNQRAGWIRNVTPDCDVPEGWKRGEARWDARYGAKKCPHVVELGRHLIKGELPPPRPGHRLKWLRGRPITWGGRCESNLASCDDRIACARGLARVPETDTHNAFWCVPNRPGCRRDAEPICEKLGYGHLVKTRPEGEERQGG